MEELHCLWMTANTLTLWRAQTLSLPLELCENLFYDAGFFLSQRSASAYGSPNEHLPGAAIPRKPPTVFF